MNDSSPEIIRPRHRPLRLILGGFGILLVVLLGALVINAVYWANKMGVFAAGVSPVTDSLVALEYLPPGDAAAGEALFTGEAACQACHKVDAGESGIGPSLIGLATHAADAIPDMTAEAYMLQSIVNPNAHIVEGYSGGLMPPKFGQRLSRQQLADLLAFLTMLE